MATEHAIDHWPRVWVNEVIPMACRVCQEPCYETGWVKYEGPGFGVCVCCVDDLTRTREAKTAPGNPSA